MSDEAAPGGRRAPRQVWLVARREVRSRLRSRALKVTTSLFVVVILAIGVINRVARGDGPSRTVVATVGVIPGGFDQALAQSAAIADVPFTLSAPLPDRAAAERALRDGSVDVVVDAGARQLVFHSSVDAAEAAVVGAAWHASSAQQAAEDANLSPEVVAAVIAPPGLSTAVVSQPRSDNVGRLVGTLAAILLFLSLNTFGAMVLTGVVEEKTSAVVEILLAHVRAHVLLAGKVLGIGVVAMLQFAVLIGVGVVALRISGTSVPPAVWVALPTTLGWFIGGFAFYATLFALAGSFVSRQEDAQSSAAPVSLIFTAGYIVVFVVAGDPGSTVAAVLSVLPPFAPLLMPLRIATGTAAAWQVVLAAVLLVGAVWVVIRAAGTIYAQTLLHRGSRITWRQALRLRSPD
jgi:ABC-2 type transport system permease protein